ncbi:MAG: lipid-A-disaccharide synthase N-terminal domain-containing protein [Limisphaera sp.]|nr:lipid-A-disaccharide synthase N-terminal domain-containing protein [Limisphaera sp.]
MNWLDQVLFPGGQFLGIRWSVWKVIGWTGNLIFFSRFFVQWYATEKLKRVVVPPAFWWLSLAGSFLLLVYALRQRDSVFIFAYLFTWIPYIRNLVIHYRHANAHLECGGCGQRCPPGSRFCMACGAPLFDRPGAPAPPSPQPNPDAAR